MPALLTESLQVSLLNSAVSLIDDQSGQASPLWLVAYSGGLDSHVMLHSMLNVCRSDTFKSAMAAKQLILPRIEVVHVNHGLQVEADNWAKHCQQICDNLAIPLHNLKADIVCSSNVEAEARKARYRLFYEVIQQKQQTNVYAYTAIFVAQHQQDHIETFLYRLMRGAGLKGLQGMKQKMSLSDIDASLGVNDNGKVGSSLQLNYVLRPLLDYSQAELNDYAHINALHWVEDTSNLDERFDRNFLRHSILPSMLARWPQLTNRLSKNIKYLQQSQAMLDELAKLDLQQSQNHAVSLQQIERRTDQSYFSFPDPAFYFEYFLALAEGKARFVNALQFWLNAQASKQSLFMPMSETQLESLVDQVFNPLYSKTIVFELSCARYRLHSFQRALYLVNDQNTVNQSPAVMHWLTGSLTWCGVVYTCTGNFDFEVRRRPEGGRMHIRGTHRKLKALLQEAEVPTWHRDRLPYFYVGSELVAVGSVYRSDTLVAQDIVISSQ